MQAYDQKADEIVKEAIQQRIDQLMPLFTGGKERGKEVENYLAWAMESLVWRIERGLRVEIRQLPPPAPSGQPAETSAERAAAQEIADAQKTLDYPEAKGAPILRLPSPEPKQPDAGVKSKRATKTKSGKGSASEA